MRTLINVDNARAILTQCARLRVVYMLGFLGIITLVLFFGFLLTRNNASTEFKVPAWLMLIPLAIFLLYSITVKAKLDQQLYNELIEYQLSGMAKKEYIVHKAGDDRSKTPFVASVTSAGILGGVGVLGPWMRGSTA